MKRWIYTLGGFLALVSAGVFFLADITRKDIIAANAFSMLVQTEPLSAGDIVVLDGDGRMSQLCDAVVDPAAVEAPDRSGVYFNRADRILAKSFDLAAGIGLLSAEKAALFRQNQKLPFVGSSSSLIAATYTYRRPEACECDVARALSRGDKVCTVNASLIETKEAMFAADGTLRTRPVERAIAVTLKRNVMHVPEQVFSECGVDYTREARMTQQMLCNESSSLPRDVRLRKRLNLIDQEPLALPQPVVLKLEE